MMMQELKGYTDEQLSHLQFEMACRGNAVAGLAISYFRQFYGKNVRVVKGRKVPKGTVGVCFWMGSRDYSRYGDPWGIYTKFRVGIRDDEGQVYWTSLDNIELA